jgi:hypothetical protein
MIAQIFFPTRNDSVPAQVIDVCGRKISVYITVPANGRVPHSVAGKKGRSIEILGATLEEACLKKG